MESDDETYGSKGSSYTTEFRQLDPRIGRWLITDPVTHEYMSPYNSFDNNPIIVGDPSGADGEHEYDKEKGEWVKTSTKGDDIGVDFYHSYDTDIEGKVTQTTHVLDKEGNYNTISNGKYVLSGEKRDNVTNWGDIYNEWNDGTGPERSYFEGSHPANESLEKNYLYSDAYRKFEKLGVDKKAMKINYYPGDIIGTGYNGQVQMMGSYNLSFYKLGESKVLSIAQDTKSRTSFYYHLPGIENYDRRDGEVRQDAYFLGNRTSTTYQTYLFIKKVK
jgi:RHS repeat-associated protein